MKYIFFHFKMTNICINILLYIYNHFSLAGGSSLSLSLELTKLKLRTFCVGTSKITIHAGVDPLRPDADVPCDDNERQKDDRLQHPADHEPAELRHQRVEGPALLHRANRLLAITRLEL